MIAITIIMGRARTRPDTTKRRMPWLTTTALPVPRRYPMPPPPVRIAASRCNSRLCRRRPRLSHLGGKLQVIGTLIIAGAIIATVTGGWWGPALLFPGVVLFILGRFW